ncbi:unnamed protein product [Ostreobium quekettii]|uniref:MORN repeat-containing protein 3 n=1 Tax=Ostreobium quekettii TaxID=121088 RepID=A0A8S1J5L1_9CHLO|nr:unnamed protein product [Ostreobium quekettii]|eukprot:evm.model.scf_492.5 EVM.evm.TU.scf_492.5   scf_492:59280-63573(-)
MAPDAAPRPRDAPSRSSQRFGSGDGARPSTKYREPEPPSHLALRRAASRPRPILPRRQSPRQWRVASTERFPLRSSVTGRGRAGREGELVADNGDRYIGEVLAGRPHGHGKYLAVSGSSHVVQYEGEFASGARCGRGVRYYPNGEVYSGEWVDGRRHGRGTMAYSNGDVYDGNWVDDRREGTASFRHSNGDLFVGTFVDGRKEGLGTLYLVQQGKKYVAEYCDNVPKCGTFVDIDSSELSPLTEDMHGTLQALTSHLEASGGNESPRGARLPSLQLEQPFKMLVKEMVGIRQSRSGAGPSDTGRGGQLGGTMHPLDMELLRHTFTQLVGGDGRDGALIPQQLRDLIHLSGQDPSHPATQGIVAQWLAERRGHGIRFEDFLRAVGHFRDRDIEEGEFQCLAATVA